MTRSAAASVPAASRSARNTGISASGPRSRSSDTSSVTTSRCRCSTRDPVVGTHHVVRSDALERGDGGLGRAGDDHVGGVTEQRQVAVLVDRRVADLGAEQPDEVAGQVLQRRPSAAPAAVVRRDGPRDHALEQAQRGLHLVVDDVGEVPVPDGRPDVGALPGVGQPGQVDLARDDAVLEVVHGVGDVVGEVHHLCLDAAPRVPRRPHGASEDLRSSS